MNVHSVSITTEDKRQRILEATLDLIDERGLQSTPMSAIARRAGVAMGTIYHHFESKEELVAALFLELSDEMGRYALLDYAADAPVRTRFTQIWMNLLRYWLRHPKEVLFLDQYAYSPYIDPAAKKSSIGWEMALYQIMVDGQTQEIVKPLNPELLIHMTLGMLGSLVKGHIAGKFTLDDQGAKAAIDACWDAVKQ